MLIAGVCRDASSSSSVKYGVGQLRVLRDASRPRCRCRRRPSSPRSGAQAAGAVEARRSSTPVTATSDGAAVDADQRQPDRLSGDHQAVVGDRVERQAVRREHGVLIVALLRASAGSRFRTARRRSGRIEASCARSARTAARPASIGAAVAGVVAAVEGLLAPAALVRTIAARPLVSAGGRIRAGVLRESGEAECRCRRRATLRLSPSARESCVSIS